MASVYSNSYLNIAATGSSDSSKAFLSLRSVDHSSVPAFKTSAITEPRGGEDGVLVRTSLNEVHRLYSTPSKNVNWGSGENGSVDAPLLSRAWVFQERHLAPRTLHFYPSELVMECRAGLRCECTGLDSFSSNPLRKFEDMSFHSWLQVVEEYSRLRLTYQSDRLVALMGVAKVFWKRLGCSYLKGIWVGDVVRGLLWTVTRYESQLLSSRTRRQEREVSPTWSWASIVLADGNGIIFPAGHDESFVVDDHFEFLDTDPPSEESTSMIFANESGAIWIKSLVVNATACFSARTGEREYEALLIFVQDVDDLVLITTVGMETDVLTNPENQSPNTALELCCLLLGSMTERDWESNQETKYYCTLVLQPSSAVLCAWERIGVLDIREDSGILEGLEEKKFKVV
jgi:hypothetical protein